MKTFLSIGLTLYFAAASAGAPSTTEDRIRQVQGLVPPVLVNGEPPKLQPLAARMAELKVPGVSVAVIHEGRIEWARGFGVTQTGGSPVTEKTLFQAASISKPVFALAVLHQVDAGKLDLDTNVNGYLKSWKLPENDLTRQKPVTLRETLTHSAGLSVHGFPGYAADGKLPDITQILDGSPPANTAPIRVDLLPGSQWRYSGGGYSVVQQLMIDVTGTPFPELMQGVVLGKLEMKDSAFSQPLRKDLEDIAATGHDAAGELIKGRWHTFPEMAAAGLWTTPSDLARFAVEVQQSFRGKSGKILSAEMTRQMLSRQLGGYGMGLWLGGKEQVTNFSHAGANEGFTCVMFASLDTGQGAVVMTNGDRGSGLFNEILRAIAHEYGWHD